MAVFLCGLWGGVGGAQGSTMRILHSANGQEHMPCQHAAS